MTSRNGRMVAVAALCLLAACNSQASDDADVRAQLDAILPAEIGGHQLTEQPVSDMGVEEMVAAVGAEPADLTVANAGSAEAGIVIVAYKVEGVSGHAIVNAFRDQADYDEVQIAGKRVLRFAAGGGVHLYATDDVAFQLHGDGAVVEEALTKLP